MRVKVEIELPGYVEGIDQLVCGTYQLNDLDVDVWIGMWPMALRAMTDDLTKKVHDVGVSK